MKPEANVNAQSARPGRRKPLRLVLVVLAVVLVVMILILIIKYPKPQRHPAKEESPPGAEEESPESSCSSRGAAISSRESMPGCRIRSKLEVLADGCEDAEEKTILEMEREGPENGNEKTNSRCCSGDSCDAEPDDDNNGPLISGHRRPGRAEARLKEVRPCIHHVGSRCRECQNYLNEHTSPGLRPLANHSGEKEEEIEYWPISECVIPNRISGEDNPHRPCNK